MTSNLSQLYHEGRFQDLLDLATSLLDEIKRSEDWDAGDLCGLQIWMALAMMRLGNREGALTSLELGFETYDPSDCTVPRDDEGRLFRDGRELLSHLQQSLASAPRQREKTPWRTLEGELPDWCSQTLEAFQKSCESTGADACFVAHRGRVLLEWYSPLYHEPVFTMSSMKSWTAILAALLAGEQKLRFDDPVAQWIPEWKAGSNAGVTIRHLLTMTSGLAHRSEEQSVVTAANKNEFVFGLPLDNPPGTGFEYSNEGVQLLSPILTRAADEDLDSYAKRRLFAPLHMHQTRLRRDQAGAVLTYADACTTLLDFPKVAQFVADGGYSLSGEQVLARHLLDELLSPLPQNPHCGLLWWRPTYSHYQAFMTCGYLHNDTLVVPELELTIARIQGAPGNGKDTFDRNLYAAMVDPRFLEYG